MVPVLRFLALALLAAPAWADEGAYVPYAGIVFGTEGTVPIDLHVVMVGTPLACEASLAHWYSAPLTAGPDNVVEATLWHERQTGALNLLAPDGARMPIEAIRCGPRGRVHAQGSNLALPIVAGEAPMRLDFICGWDANRLVCQGS